MSTSSVVSCQLRARSVSAWTLSTMRLMLFFDGRKPNRAGPREYMFDRGRLLAHRSVGGKYSAAERGRAPSDFAADVAKPDDADGLTADLAAHCAPHHRAPGPRSLTERRRDVEQPVAPSQHHHDRKFAKRRLVAICIAQGDAPRQRRDIDAARPAIRHLQQAHLRSRRKSASPASGQQYIRIGECGSCLCRVVVIKDFGT